MTTTHSVKFEPGNLYHVYNRGNQNQIIFFLQRNYLHFLSLIDKYLIPVSNLYSYCLMPNHFHLLIMVKSLEAIHENLCGVSTHSDALDENLASHAISEQFRRLFMSYAKAINRQENLAGSLFQKNVKRRRIEHDQHLLNLIYYIHHNPVHHKIIDDFTEYPWSSYRSLISSRETKLSRESVMEWFGGAEAFIDFHSLKHIMNDDFEL
ncbi:MAG: transposase [Fidelibacterota bacterium]